MILVLIRISVLVTKKFHVWSPPSSNTWISPSLARRNMTLTGYLLVTWQAYYRVWCNTGLHKHKQRHWHASVITIISGYEALRWPSSCCVMMIDLQKQTGPHDAHTHKSISLKYHLLHDCSILNLWSALTTKDTLKNPWGDVCDFWVCMKQIVGFYFVLSCFNFVPICSLISLSLCLLQSQHSH